MLMSVFIVLKIGTDIGLERTVAWICGLPHIRESVPYARMLNRKSP